MSSETQVKERYQVRDMRGAEWDWIPEDWCVVDTEEQRRISVHTTEKQAHTFCDGLNVGAKEGDR
jgi:hypothetical protein